MVEQLVLIDLPFDDGKKEHETRNVTIRLKPKKNGSAADREIDPGSVHLLLPEGPPPYIKTTLPVLENGTVKFEATVHPELLRHDDRAQLINERYLIEIKAKAKAVGGETEPKLLSRQCEVRVGAAVRINWTASPVKGIYEVTSTGGAIEIPADGQSEFQLDLEAEEYRDEAWEKNNDAYEFTHYLSPKDELTTSEVNIDLNVLTPDPLPWDLADQTEQQIRTNWKSAAELPSDDPGLKHLPPLPFDSFILVRAWPRGKIKSRIPNHLIPQPGKEDVNFGAQIRIPVRFIPGTMQVALEEPTEPVPTDAETHQSGVDVVLRFYYPSKDGEIPAVEEEVEWELVNPDRGPIGKVLGELGEPGPSAQGITDEKGMIRFRYYPPEMYLKPGVRSVERIEVFSLDRRGERHRIDTVKLPLLPEIRLWMIKEPYFVIPKGKFSERGIPIEIPAEQVDQLKQLFRNGGKLAIKPAAILEDIQDINNRTVTSESWIKEARWWFGDREGEARSQFNTEEDKGYLFDIEAASDVDVNAPTDTVIIEPEIPLLGPVAKSLAEILKAALTIDDKYETTIRKPALDFIQATLDHICEEPERKLNEQQESLKERLVALPTFLSYMLAVALTHTRALDIHSESYRRYVENLVSLIVEILMLEDYWTPKGGWKKTHEEFVIYGYIKSGTDGAKNVLGAVIKQPVKSAVNAMVGRISKYVDELVEEVSQLKTIRDQVRKPIDKLVTESRRLAQGIVERSRLLKEARVKRKELAEQIARLERENLEEAVEKLERARTLFDDLTGQEGTLKRELDDITNRHVDLEDEIRQLRETKLEGAKNTHLENKGQVDRLDGEIQSNRGDVLKHQRSKATLEGQIDDISEKQLRPARGELTRLERQAKELEKGLTEGAENRKNLLEAQTKLANQADELRSTSLKRAREQASNLNGQLREARERLAKLVDELGDADPQVAAASQRVAELDNLVKAADRSVDQFQRDVDKLVNNHQTLDGQIKKLDESVAGLRKQQEELTSQFDEIDKAVQGAEGRIARANREIEGLNSSITELDNKHTQLKSDFSIAEENLKKAENAVSGVEKEIETKNGELTDLESRGETKSIEHGEVAEKIEPAKDRLRDAEIEKSNIDTEIDTEKDNLLDLDNSIKDEAENLRLANKRLEEMAENVDEPYNKSLTAFDKWAEAELKLKNRQLWLLAAKKLQAQAGLLTTEEYQLALKELQATYPKIEQELSNYADNLAKKWLKEGYEEYKEFWRNVEIANEQEGTEWIPLKMIANREKAYIFEAEAGLMGIVEEGLEEEAKGKFKEVQDFTDGFHRDLQRRRRPRPPKYDSYFLDMVDIIAKGFKEFIGGIISLALYAWSWIKAIPIFGAIAEFLLQILVMLIGVIIGIVTWFLQTLIEWTSWAAEYVGDSVLPEGERDEAKTFLLQKTDIQDNYFSADQERVARVAEALDLKNVVDDTRLGKERAKQTLIGRFQGAYKSYYEAQTVSTRIAIVQMSEMALDKSWLTGSQSIGVWTDAAGQSPLHKVVEELKDYENAFMHSGDKSIPTASYRHLMEKWDMPSDWTIHDWDYLIDWWLSMIAWTIRAGALFFGIVGLIAMLTGVGAPVGAAAIGGALAVTGLIDLLSAAARTVILSVGSMIQVMTIQHDILIAGAMVYLKAFKGPPGGN